MTGTAARALVVDDDRSWQEIIQEILEDAGFSVDVADTLASARNVISQPHQVAIIDLALKERDHHNQDGLSILSWLKAQDPACAAILLTGHATVELAVDAIKQYGAYDVLRKEVFNRGELRRLLTKIQASPSSDPAHPTEKGLTPGLAIPSKATDRKVNVLVVDDDQSWQEILVELLADAGFQVRVCSSFGEALGCLRRERYELAIVDLRLTRSGSDLSGQSRPENLEGYRLLVGIQGGGTPVIVLSGLADPALIEVTFAQQNVFAFLEKQSFNRRIFIRTVNEALEKASVNPELDQLTGREQDVLQLLAQGMTNKEIAEKLVITTNTVKRHLKSIFAKLDIHNRAAAVAKARGEHRMSGD